MDITIAFTVILCFLILRAEKTVAQCKPRRKEFSLEFNDKVVISKTLGTSSKAEEVICQFSCHAHDHCDAYNFNLKDERCEILDEQSTSFKVEKRKGWIFKAQKCEKDPCKKGGTCFHAVGKDRCLCLCKWKGEICNVPVVNPDNVFSFPGGSVGDMVVSINPFSASLSKLTVSMWMQVDPATNGKQPTPICYTTTATNDVIAVMLMPDNTRITVNGVRKKFIDPSQLITDSNWHHFLFTWESTTGNLALYIDGDKKGEKNSVSTGVPIAAGGALVLGQDQDGYLNRYNPNQAYKGNLTSLNMWDRVLTSSEISDLASKCVTQEGNIIQWSQLRNLPRAGNVKLICSSFCVT